MKRWIAVMVMVGLSGCTQIGQAFQPVVDRYVENPAGASLVTIEEAMKAANQAYYARDLALIDQCKVENTAGTDTSVACEGLRCDDADCVMWRLELYPKLRVAYNAAVAGYTVNRDSKSVAALILSAGSQAAATFRSVAQIDPDAGRQRLWLYLASEIERQLGLAVVQPAKEGGQ